MRDELVALREMADRPPTAATEFERLSEIALDCVSLLDATLMLGGGGDGARGASVTGEGGDTSSSLWSARV